MAGSLLLELQKAVYSKLSGDAALMAKVTGVFDSVPDSQAFPYITIGEATEVPFSAFSSVGKESTLTLHIWSRYSGFKEALDVLKRVNELLDGATLTITGYALVDMSLEMSETLRDPDGVTRHVAARFRCLAREA